MHFCIKNSAFWQNDALDPIYKIKHTFDTSPSMISIYMPLYLFYVLSA